MSEESAEAGRIVTEDIETVLAATGVTANTWQSAARRLADENRRLRRALAGDGAA